MASSELSLFFDLLVADRAIGELLALTLADSDLTPLDYAIYSAVAQDPGITATTLAHRLSSPLTTVVDWLAKPIERGHIERRRLATDGRAWGLTLTESGGASHERARLAFADMYRRYRRRPDVDIAAQTAAVGAIIHAVRELTADLRGAAE